VLINSWVFASSANLYVLRFFPNYVTALKLFPNAITARQIKHVVQFLQAYPGIWTNTDVVRGYPKPGETRDRTEIHNSGIERISLKLRPLPPTKCSLVQLLVPLLHRRRDISLPQHSAKLKLLSLVPEEELANLSPYSSKVTLSSHPSTCTISAVPQVLLQMLAILILPAKCVLFLVFKSIVSRAEGITIHDV